MSAHSQRVGLRESILCEGGKGKAKAEAKAKEKDGGRETEDGTEIVGSLQLIEGMEGG